MNEDLLQTDDLEIAGYGLNRSVILHPSDDKLKKVLTPDKSLKVRNHSPDGFNWGYSGSGPAQLSLAILLELVTEEEACRVYQEFKQVIIASLPGSNFRVKIKMNKLLSILLNKEPAEYPYTLAYSFVEVFIPSGNAQLLRKNGEEQMPVGFYVSKFLDFLTMKFRSASFAEDTIENKLLSDLILSGYWGAFNEYLKIHSTVKNSKGITEFMEIHIYPTKKGQIFEVTGGLGTGTYLGHKQK